MHFQKGTEYNPLITIIIAVYNGEKHLAEAIESITQQTYRNIELIIIDGNSSDNTTNIIEKYQSQIAYCVSEPDKGIYDAWNKGICVSQGNWICFLGSDDIFLPDAIEKYVAFIRNNNSQNAEYISSEVQLITETGKLLRKIGQPWQWDKFKIFMNVAHMGSFHHKSLFENYGLYDTSYKIAADYEFLLRARENLKADVLDDVTAKMRIGGASLRNTKVFKETLIAKNKTGGRDILLCLVDYFIARSKYLIQNLLFRR